MTAQDVYGATQVRQILGETYLVLSRREKAIAIFREMTTEPCKLSSDEVRIDPLWSRLKDDARFEEILKSAKAL